MLCEHVGKSRVGCWNNHHQCVQFRTIERQVETIRCYLSTRPVHIQACTGDFSWQVMYLTLYAQREQTIWVSPSTTQSIQVCPYHVFRLGFTTVNIFKAHVCWVWHAYCICERRASWDSNTWWLLQKETCFNENQWRNVSLRKFPTHLCMPFYRNTKVKYTLPYRSLNRIYVCTETTPMRFEPCSDNKLNTKNTWVPGVALWRYVVDLINRSLIMR